MEGEGVAVDGWWCVKLDGNEFSGGKDAQASVYFKDNLFAYFFF